MKRVVVAIMFVIILVLASAGCSGDPDPPSEEEVSEEETLNSAPGDFGKAFLQGTNFTKVLIEVDHMPGMEPDQESIDLLKARISTYCDKTSVEVLAYEEVPAGDGTYSVNEIAQIEEAHRDNFYDRTNRTITLYILYLDGASEDGNVLGVTYRGSSFAIFKAQIDSLVIPFWASGPLYGVEHSDFEKAVLVHEFGHIIRLVNVNYSSDISHEDPEHPHHSIHEDCVMYYAIETTVILQIINTGSPKPPTDFHADSIADINDLRSDYY